MEIVTLILQAILAIAVPALAIVIKIVAAQFAEILAQKIKNEAAKVAIQEGLNILADSVNCIQQTYVDELKAQGTFDKDAQLAALTKAKNQAISLMNAEVREALSSQYEDVDAFMTTFIESLIAQSK